MTHLGDYLILPAPAWRVTEWDDAPEGDGYAEGDGYSFELRATSAEPFRYARRINDGTWEATAYAIRRNDGTYVHAGANFEDITASLPAGEASDRETVIASYLTRAQL